MSGAFDDNRTPFLQSFVEVKVERSANRVRLIPGPVRWKQLDAFGAGRPFGATDSDVVQFVAPMAR